MNAEGHKGTFGDDGNILDLDFGGVCITMHLLKLIKLRTLKVNFLSI